MADGALENHAEFPKYKVWTALAMIEDLFGLDIPKTRFEEYAEYAFKEIGTNIALIKTEGTILEGGYIKLPCDARIIKAVSMDLITFSKWNAINIGQDNLKSIDGFYYYQDASRSTALPQGNYVTYNFIDSDTIQIDPSLYNGDSLVGDYAYVLMYADYMDEEGWPMVTHKQALAIAWYCAFLHSQRELFRGIEMKVPFEYVQKEAFRKLAAAKVPEYISDNEMDQILNAKFSFNRKRYNTDYKAEGANSRQPRSLRQSDWL